MSAQPGRGYLGISEVLAQLRPDFADISVSKIRFLETEGLITPARSPSGYRRFCAADVDRLRYILAAQRDQYLPLKVIKDRLDRFDRQDAPGWSGPGVPGGLPAQPGGPAWSGAPVPAGVPAQGEASAQPGTPAARSAMAARPAIPAQPGRAGGGGWSAAGWAAADRGHDPSHEPGYRRPGSEPGGQGAGAAGDELLTRRDLLEAAGISEALLTELDTFGLLRHAGRYYGSDALEVARTAVALTAYGVEARHLRAVRAAAERETTMIESLVAPIVRQRAKGAAELASRTAGELAGLVLRLHCALVDGALAEAGLAGLAAPGQVAAEAAPERPAARGVGGATA